MKKLIQITLALAALAIAGCDSRNGKPTGQNTARSVAPTPHSATEELKKWFTQFKDYKGMAIIFDSIEAEYPAMMADIAFLDSVKSLRIDFVGMTHTSYGVGPADSMLEKSIIVCQSSIERELGKERYDCIGTEISTIDGPIRLPAFLSEQANAGSTIVFLSTGIVSKQSLSQADSTFRKFTPNDFILKRLFAGNRNGPAIIGTEPKWVWLAEQLLRAQDLNAVPAELRSKISEVILLLNHSRSEISLARTARYLCKIGREKQAVIVYGRDHLADFQVLAEKFGTNSKFILTKECQF